MTKSLYYRCSIWKDNAVLEYIVVKGKRGIKKKAEELGLYYGGFKTEYHSVGDRMVYKNNWLKVEYSL